MVVKSVKIRASELNAPEVLEVDTVEDHAYIPDADYALKYVHRKIDGVYDFDLLDMCYQKAWNVLLRGDTGSGKTMLPMAYAAQNNLRYFSVPCDISIDPRALFGKMMPTKKVGEFKWVDGPVTEMVRHGGVLNISEINFMPAKIAASLYQLLDHRRSLTLLEHEGETIRAHGPNCWCDLDDCEDRWLLIVADMNPKYRGTTDLNLALANRFPVRPDWGYSAEVEEKVVKSKELLDLVQKIRAVAQIRTPISTNSMLEFIEIAVTLGYDFAAQNFVNMFADPEREAVKNSLDGASVNIKRDIDALMQGKLSHDLLKEVPEDKAWFEKAKDGVELDDYVWDPA